MNPPVCKRANKGLIQHIKVRNLKVEEARRVCLTVSIAGDTVGLLDDFVAVEHGLNLDAVVVKVVHDACVRPTVRRWLPFLSGTCNSS